MLNFIEEKNNLNAKRKLNENVNYSIENNNPNSEANVGFYNYEILDINGNVINKKVKEIILNKIYANFFSNNFSNLEFSCLTSPAKIRALDSNFIIKQGDEFNKIFYVSKLSEYSFIELKRQSYTNLKIQKNHWIGLEKLISVYIEPSKKHLYEDDIEYLKLDKSLSQRVDDSEINKFFKNERISPINLSTNQDEIFENFQKKKTNFISNRNIIDFSKQNNHYDFESLNQYLNFDFVLEWDVNVFLEIFEKFKDDVFLKKLYIEWLKQMTEHTVHFNNDIAKSLKQVYQEQEKFDSENRQAPFFRKLSEVERREDEVTEFNKRKSTQRVSIENIEL